MPEDRIPLLLMADLVSELEIRPEISVGFRFTLLLRPYLYIDAVVILKLSELVIDKEGVFERLFGRIFRLVVDFEMLQPIIFFAEIFSFKIFLYMLEKSFSDCLLLLLFDLTDLLDR